MTVTIETNCTACGGCLVTCPTRALVPAPLRPRVVDARCTDCWLCLEICPVDAITAHDSDAITAHGSTASPPPTGRGTPRRAPAGDTADHREQPR